MSHLTSFFIPSFTILQEYVRGSTYDEPSTTEDDECADLTFSYTSSLARGCADLNEPVVYQYATGGVRLSFRIGSDYEGVGGDCVLLDVEGRHDTWEKLMATGNKLVAMQWDTKEMGLVFDVRHKEDANNTYRFMISDTASENGVISEDMTNALVNPLACMCEMVTYEGGFVSTVMTPPLYDREQIGNAITRIVNNIATEVPDPQVTVPCLATNLQQLSYTWVSGEWIHSTNATKAVSHAKFRFVKSSRDNCSMWMHALMRRADLLSNDATIHAVPGSLVTPYTQQEESDGGGEPGWYVFVIIAFMVIIILAVGVVVYRERVWVRNILFGKTRRSSPTHADTECTPVPAFPQSEVPGSNPIDDFRGEQCVHPLPSQAGGAHPHPHYPFPPHSNAASLSLYKPSPEPSPQAGYPMHYGASPVETGEGHLAIPQGLRGRAAQHQQQYPTSPPQVLPSPGLAAQPRGRGLNTPKGGMDYVPGPGWESTYDGTELSDIYTPGMPLAHRASNGNLHSSFAQGQMALDHDYVPPVSRLYRNSSGMLVEDHGSEYSQ